MTARTTSPAQLCVHNLDAILAVVALASSVYVVYTLEILKLRRLRALRAARRTPAEVTQSRPAA